MALADSASTTAARFASLSIPRQIGLLVGLAASIAMGFMVVLWSREPAYAPLFNQVSTRDSAEIVTALERYDIKYKLDQSSGTVLVPMEKMQTARLKLASEGLPRESSESELFANNNVFSNSQFMETARYKQSLESELARTISKFNEIKSARVHLAIPKESSFVRDSQKPSASVFLDVYPGVDLRKRTIASIVNLVASSIPNLTASMVTVVDQNGQLLNEGGGQSTLSESERYLDYRQSIEQQYAQKIQEILIPVYGVGRIKAKVSADIDFTSYEQTQELYNPELPSIRSEQSMDEQRTSGQGAAGVPGTISNLPQPTGVGKSQINSSTQQIGLNQDVHRKQSTKNFELDKTVSHTKNQPGTIKRVTVAVLVDNKATLDPATKKLEKKPLTPEEINQIKLLVADAVGLNPKRGDSLNVINSSFVQPEAIAPLPDEPIWKTDLFWTIVKQGVGGIFVLILLFGVLKPMLNALATNKVRIDAQPQMKQSSQNASGAEDSKNSAVPAISLKDIVNYDEQLDVVRKVAEKEPKRVAQVVKNWVDRG